MTTVIHANKKVEIPGLTILRGSAALFVAIHHFGLLSLPLRGTEIAPVLSKFGLLGMSLFFILSGFVINYSYGDQIRSFDPPGIKKFLVARIARLAPLYLLFVACNFVLNCLFIDPQNTLIYIKALPLNLLAIQSWFYVKVHGVDLVSTQGLANISWSISTEWMLYLLYLPFSFFFLRGESTLKRGVLLLFTGIIFRVLLVESLTESISIHENKFGEWLLYYSPYGRWFEFMSGIGLSEIWIRRSQITRRIHLLICIAAALSLVYIAFSLLDTLLINMPIFYSGYRAYSGFAIAVPFVVFMACNTVISKKNYYLLTPLLFLGEISYSVYLLHGDLIHIFRTPSPLPLEGYLVKSLFFFSWLILLSNICFKFFEIPCKKMVTALIMGAARQSPQDQKNNFFVDARVFIKGNSLTLLTLTLLMLTAFYIAPMPSWKSRVQDLSSIKLLLETYYKENGSYPVADYSSLISSKFVINENWIPGLVPKYTPALPRDVRKNNIPGEQYLYVSDGREYKLIAHGVDDAGVVEKTFPGLIDPRRPTYSYGFWTPGAEKW
jgi:peptidoglycan/LPS O-acetylase OafA/YrhL